MPIDITKNWCRKRIEPPGKFDKKSLRIKKVSNKTQIVVGCPKGKFHSGRCSVGMKLQSLRKRKLSSGGCPVM